MKSKLPIVKRCALIFGVLVIPILYSYFYLGAFWDPYNSLDKLPVAVVNEDKGAVINGESRNLGDEMVSSMRQDGTLKWEFTDAESARNGVDGKKYYAEIVIPADFSKDIASASTTDKTTAVIQYSANEKRNYLASQILSRAVVELEEQTRSTVNKEITLELTSKLSSVPQNLSTLSSGISELSSGANDLKNGSDSLDSGLKQLSSGSSALSAGAKSLNENLGLALQGARTLMLQFSPGTASSPTLYDGLHGIQNGVAQLLAQFKPDPTGKSPTAYDQFNASADAYVNAANQTYYGILYAQYAADVQSLGTTGASYAFGQQITGMKAQLDADLQTYLTNGTDQNQNTVIADVNLYNLYNAFYNTTVLNHGDVSSFLSAVNQNTYSYQRDPALTSYIETAFAPYVAHSQYHDTVPASAVAAQTETTVDRNVAAINAQNIVLAGSAFKNGVDTQLFGALSSNVSVLYDASRQMTAQLAAAAAGSPSTLYDGMNELSGALGQLKDGSSQLASGAAQTAAGASSAQAGGDALASGAASLSDGLNTAGSGVASSVADAENQSKAASGLDTYAAVPVSVKQSPVNPVPNYGTAFAPYFLSLSLWVGALIIMVGIFLDPNEKIKSLSRHSDRRVFRTLIYFLLGFGQAILLALIIRFGLNLTVKNMAAYLAACVLISFTFLSIVQCLIVYLSDVGKFLAIAFLILQLTSCGGTFPMETVPKIFNVLYPYMPMTYSVGLFKEVVSGVNVSNAMFNAYVLLAVFAVFTSINLLFSAARFAKVRVQKRLEADLKNE